MTRLELHGLSAVQESGHWRIEGFRYDDQPTETPRELRGRLFSSRVAAMRVADDWISNSVYGEPA